MRSSFLPFSPPFVGEEEVQEVAAALRSGWISRGPRTGEFEEQFRDYIGAPAALALNSCTAGLHLALVVSGIGPGDEVIVPALTFCASVNVVEHVGATPILVDVEPDTLNLDPAAVERAITDRTKAVMVVHFGGHPADMDVLTGLAERHGVLLIEDAAHALPAAFNGRTVGSSQNLTAFSFYATKNLTTGEGGMLTGEPHAIERARTLSLHGMTGAAWQRYSDGGSWRYEVVHPGFKYNMTDVQAALGLCQLRKLGDMQTARRERVARYLKAFADLDPIVVPVERPGVDHAWHLFTIRVKSGVSPVDRDAFIEELRHRNVGSSVHFIPIHHHPYYSEKYQYPAGSFPVTDAAFSELVSLPLHPGLTDDDVDDVTVAVREIVTGD